MGAISVQQSQDAKVEIMRGVEAKNTEVFQGGSNRRQSGRTRNLSTMYCLATAASARASSEPNRKGSLCPLTGSSEQRLPELISVG